MNQRLLKLGSITALCSLMTLSGFSQSPPNDDCGTSLRFDGVDDKITFANSPLTPSGTFEAWLSKDDWSDHVDDVLFGNNIGHLDINSFYMSLHPVVGLHMRYGGGGETGNMYTSSNDSKALVDGSWHHLAGTWHNAGGETTISIYLDGVLLDSQTQTITIDMGSTFQIGINPSSGTLKNAQIDEVRVWNYARSASELQANMNSPLVGNETGLNDYYNFNNTEGLTILVDQTKDGDSGELIDIDPATAYLFENGSATTCPLSPPNDDCGTVLNFDGTNDYVEMADNSILDFTSTEAFTAEGWFKTSNNFTVLSKAGISPEYQGYQIIVISSGAVSFGLHSNFGLGDYIEVKSSTTNLNDDVWHHVAVSYDGSKSASGIKMYVDGTEETLDITQNNLTGEISNSSIFNIGARSGARLGNGQIDEVRIWNAVLSGSTISSNMADELSGSEPDLVAYYNFNDGTNSSILADLAGDADGNLMGMNATNDWTLLDGTTGGKITIAPQDLSLAIGDSLLINGVYEKFTGTYFETLTTTTGCDSNLTYNVTVYGEPENASCETALNFDGANDYIQLSEPLSIGSSSNTLELWVKIPLINTEGLTSTERVGNIIGNYNNTPNTNWELHSAGQVRVYWNNGEINTFGSIDLRDNTWHHLAFVRNTDDDTYKVYVDGSLDLDHPSAGSDITFASAPRIGADNRSGGGPKFHGAMDEIRVWDFAMTPEQIVWAASGQVDDSENGLVNYFDFNEGTGSTDLVDLTSSENNGTLVSMDENTDWTTNDGTVLPAIDLVSIEVTDPNCNGENDGDIEITATGGTGALSYSIDDGESFETTALFEDLEEGEYEIIVMDAIGCEISGSIELIDPAAIDLISIALIDPECVGENGSIVITATGGTPDLIYSIDNGVSFELSNSFDTLAGDYDVVIEDDNGCQEGSSITLTDPTAIDLISVAVSDPKCIGEVGQIEIVATGGTPDLAYSIDGGDTFLPTNTFLTEADEYDIVVEDDNGCYIETTVTLTDPAPVDNSVVQVGNELTAGSSSGTFQWLNCNDDSQITDETASLFTAVNSGIYSVEVSEGSCVDTSDCFTVIITDIAPNSIENGLQVYPNPTAGFTNIDLGQSFNSGIVTISDITGQTIEQVELHGENIISVTIEKPAGVYFVNIKSGELQKTIKIIKE